MTVSVVIAAYCGEKFIGEQIASLLTQTLPPDEIVITDDSPDERTMAAVANWLSDPRVRYFHNEKQLGVNGNFEKALSLAGGDIIFFCDQDDVWLPEKIAEMVAALENSPDADGVFCNSTVVNSSLEPSGYSLWQMRGFTGKMQKKFASGSQAELFLKRVTCSTHNIAIRRRILDRVLPFPVLDPFFADTFLGLLLAAENKWVMLDRELTCYRVHGGNLSVPKLANIREQAELSRKARQKNALVRRVSLCEAVLERLPENIPADIRNKFAGYRKHYLVRSGYSANFFIRAAQITAEILSLRYSCYSNGWKSIAADLFLFR